MPAAADCSSLLTRRPCTPGQHELAQKPCHNGRPVRRSTAAFDESRSGNSGAPLYNAEMA
jgi:hypothetical protein